MSLAADIYRRLPVWAQHGSATAYGAYWHWLRFGRGYGSFVEEYIKRERYSPEQWRQWQLQEVTSILKIAALQIPYYRANWSLGEKKAALAGRLDELPLLGKESIRVQPLDFIADGSKGLPRFSFYTSGSTGTPIRTIWRISEVRNALALREARSARWAGVSFKLPRATFSGRIVEPDPLSAGPFYRYNAVERQVYFSTAHLRPDTAELYLAALRKYEIQWMTGYAVSIYLLAQFILDRRLRAPKLRAVITTSEKLTPRMREVMEEAYQTRIYEEYSTVETALFASECNRGRLHLSPDVALVEILRPDGTPCDPGEPGEVVATSFIRKCQVFVRYRIGDVGAWDAEQCPCGLALPVIREVIGRLEDVVASPDGRVMTLASVIVNQPHIREGQIIQERINRIRIKIVPTDGFDQSDVRDISKRVHVLLGEHVEVIVETVPSIPRSKAGKFQAVINQIPVPLSSGQVQARILS